MVEINSASFEGWRVGREGLVEEDEEERDMEEHERE